MAWGRTNPKWGTLEWDGVVAEPSWVSYFAEANWTPTVGTYTPGGPGQPAWNPAFDATWDMVLTPLGGWEVGFRPTKMRITYNPTIDTTGVSLWDDTTEIIEAYIPVGQDEEHDIVFLGNDIGSFRISSTNPFNIYDIEFYG